MLTCLPQSLCTWNFRIPDASAGPGALTFNFFTEQGAITLGGADFTIRKHGPLSGHWTLEQPSQTFADAQKPNPFTRRFEIDAAGVQLTLKANSPFTRSFEILSGDTLLGDIRPAHIFTRRACIQCDPQIPELTQLFLFWLVALAWRRQARENNSAAT